MAKLLTKSNYLTGLQCPKLLWITKNDKQRIPEPDKMTQKKFSDGHILGELAKKVFPEGQNIPDDNFMENLRNTKKLIEKRIPLFEPAFMIDGLYSRADVLVPVGEDEWNIIEVKSATKVKDMNLHDVSFQKYTYEKAGLKIRKSFLMHINNQYCLDETIEPSELFTQTDITEKVKEISEGIEPRVKDMIEIISGQEPEFSVNDMLTTEYDNICLDEFMSELPNDNIFDFYRMLKKKTIELYKDGYKLMSDVPESVKLNEKQQIQRRLANDGGKHINKVEINNFLRNLEYPIYYLDFETINPALPKFNRMKPYQRIPFQFSLHIQNEEGGECEHISFLAEGTDDTRPKFMQSLKDNLGDKGSILVYNQGFEKGVMNEGATAFPEFREWYEENILPRIKDLWDVFRNFYYYDPKQKGSASIKYVLPVLSDLSYKELDINKGDLASYQYERVTYDPLISNEAKQKVRDDLEKYCKLDTLAEVEIVGALRKLS
ncbi:DUF2779 domain-containing protein [Candidatus Pacearchaeota archaeon]|nr:DUF2779 domain-containing protein [Candidatus Pacearchaeota archaeon]